MPNLSINWSYLTPHLALCAGGLLVLCEGMIFGRNRHGLFLATTLLAGAAALAGSLCLHDQIGTTFSGSLVVDGTVAALLCVVATAVILGAAVSAAYLNRYGFQKADYYTLLLFSAFGMSLLVSAGDLAILFVALETLSICVYALTGYRVRQDASTEGALKYFLLGAFATGFLLYGIALLYGAAGTTNLAQIGTRLAEGAAGGQTRLFAVLGLGFLLIGMAFKVGAVPFHMWVPDAYQGAPTPVTAYMSVAVKAAGIGIFLRTLLAAFGGLADLWVPIVSILAVTSMLVGNLLALAQDNVKRMLAYSSISHAGYLLLGIAAAATLPREASAAVVFYLLVYSFMNVGAFTVLLAVSHERYERTRFSDLHGLSQESPVLAALLALFMLALAGIPPTGGFAAKFYLFTAAIRADMPVLASLGILFSVIGVVYYLRVVVVMYMKPRSAAPQPWGPAAARGLALTFALIACAALTLELGVQLLPSLGTVHSSYLDALSSGVAVIR